MRRENEVWHRFKECLPPLVMAIRIEDASGTLGTWDAWVGAEGRGAWFEFKHTQTVSRKPRLRPGQHGFGMRLHVAKVPGCYIVGSSDGKVRLINGLTLGEDWRDHVIEVWDGFTKENVDWLLREFQVITGKSGDI